VIIRVHPSRYQRLWLIALYLSLLLPVASLINGWLWACFMPLWLFACYQSWRALAVPAFELVWDGQLLLWQGDAYQLGKGSRILPGMLRLSLCPEIPGASPPPPKPLWLFCDALTPEHYRLLARAIHLLPSRR